MKSDAFRAAAEGKDFSAIEDLFTEEPTFRSPAVFRPYEGRDAMQAVLGAVSQVFSDFRYTDQVEDGDTAILVFKAKVGDREIDGVDILRFEGERIGELMVMIRTVRGLEAVVAEMAKRLEAAGVPVP